jgi:hypothetical protein
VTFIVLAMASIKPTPSQLYENDYYRWAQDQVRALREHRSEELDWENVAEEIDDLGKGEQWSLESYLEALFEHLLKLAYTQPTTRERNARLWQGTVKLARAKIRRRLAQSPSLRHKMDQLLAAAYEDGRTRMLARTKLGEDRIPASSPWTVEQVLDDSFLPTPATSLPGQE